MASPLPFRLVWRRDRRAPGGAELLALGGVAAAAMAVAFPHLPWLHVLWPGCAFRDLTGWPCGACGMTRAFVRAMHGDVAGALAVSPLGVGLLASWLAYAAAVLPSWALGLARPALVLEGRLGAALARWGLLAAVLGNWAYLLAVTAVTGAPPP